MKHIKFDITTYIIILLSILSGYFKDIIILYFIIIIHELGHIIYLSIFNKEIISVVIYPFGGITKYNSLINHDIFSELLIAFGGIFNQLLLYILVYIIYKYNIISINTYNIFIKYNNYLILFNLIPLLGLDGYKIVNLLLEYIMPFKLARNISFLISIITLLIFIIKTINLKVNILFILSFIIYNTINYLKNKKDIENKFYIERIIYDIPFKKIKYLKSINKNNMYQEKYHFFNNIKEYDYLKKYYNMVEK